MRSKWFHAPHALLDVVELPAIGAELFGWQSGYFLRDILNAVAGIGVITEELRSTRAALLLDFGEELCHGMRIEAGIVHDVSTEQVRFLLGLTRIFQKVRANAE